MAGALGVIDGLDAARLSASNIWPDWPETATSCSRPASVIFVLKASLRQDLVAEAWACERAHR